MKSAKPPAADGPSSRRAQPVRQTRTNPPRVSNLRGSAGGRDSLGGGPAPDQPIDIFPAITHFADAITALPKELVRHFTLLKEVDAKIFVPEEDLFQLVNAALTEPPPRPHLATEEVPGSAITSAPMSAQNSSSGAGPGSHVPSGPSATDSQGPPSVHSHNTDTRRHFYQQTAFKIQEMLGSLEEKNHVISSANDALQKQLARIDEVWPHVENEFSDEAKWGSTNHWAYPENRANNKAAHAERSRREGAAAISAAAQALAEEAAARSDARKQAVQAKKNLKTQHLEHDGDDHPKPEPTKKSSGKSRKAVDVPVNVGLGITTNGATNGNPPQPKRRKVEKPAADTAPPERAMASVFGNDAPKTKISSPKGTPVPEAAPKKRKALPSSSGQAKKRNGVGANSPSLTSSPVISALPDAKPPRGSPVPQAAKPPTTARARQNSLQSAADPSKLRPSSSASNKQNGVAPPGTPDLSTPASWPRPAASEQKVNKEPTVPAKPEPVGKAPEPVEIGVIVNTTAAKKETEKPEEPERKSEPVITQTVTAPTVTKSGRASKPSTPALGTFQEAAAARPRTARNSEAKEPSKKKKAAATPTIPPLAVAAALVAEEDGASSMQEGEEEEGEIDADEPLYCYCNSVSYGEMVACDADNCEREWFHLECVGLKVAPKGNAKWYCEPCKKRLLASGKKVNGR